MTHTEVSPRGSGGGQVSSRQQAPLYGTQSGLDVDHFRFRVLQDALTEATAAYWRRRAEALERALPRRGDFHGQATMEQLNERYDALQAEIQACRRHANLLASHTIAPLGSEAIPDVLREAS